MDHEEITTKIEIAPPKSSNIVHINFSAKRESNPSTPKRRATDSQVTVAPLSWMARIKSVDLSSPWVLRLVAVMTILILSMLVL